MEQQYDTNTKTIHPAVLAMLIWLLTSLTLGAGWLLYSVLFEIHADAFISILVSVCAALLSPPVFIVLCIAVRSIADSGRAPTGKVKQLLLTCFICTVPYAFIVNGFFMGRDEGNYMTYLLRLLAISGILFLCSIVAMLINAVFIRRLFYTETENDLAIHQIGTEMTDGIQ